jgi:pimeloyl-ACP methyl ester carboxylesterase
MILAPSAPASTDGYPIVSWAHGTTGAADQCAPSRAGIEGIPREFRDLVDRGHVVAATDYEGLGTDGVHPYIVGVSEGRSVLDSIRAAQNLADAHAGSGAVVIGHSQGGHAALFAAQLAPTYAPSLDLRGVLAASPPADLLAFDDWALRLSAAGHPNVAGPPVLVFGIWHDIYGLPLDFLTADAQAMTVSGAQSCGFPRPLANPFLSDPALDPAWRERLVENSPGSVATSVPILIVASADDEQVPHDSQVSGADAMCQAGDDVELRTVPGNHLASLWSATAWGSAQAWIADARAGEAVIPTC